jgi:hypothetical protein
MLSFRAEKVTAVICRVEKVAAVTCESRARASLRDLFRNLRCSAPEMRSEVTPDGSTFLRPFVLVAPTAEVNDATGPEVSIWEASDCALGGSRAIRTKVRFRRCEPEVRIWEVWQPCAGALSFTA